MRVGKKIRVFVSAALFLAGAVMFTLSLRESRAGMNADTAARRLSRVLERRMSQLDTYVSKALDTAPDEWMNLGSLPQDMVVYRFWLRELGPGGFVPAKTGKFVVGIGSFFATGIDNFLVVGCKHRHKAGADDRKRQTKRKNTLHQPIFFSVMIFPHSGALPAS